MSSIKIVLLIRAFNAQLEVASFAIIMTLTNGNEPAENLLTADRWRKGSKLGGFGAHYARCRSSLRKERQI